MPARHHDYPHRSTGDPWLMLVPLSLIGFVLIGAMLTSITVYAAVMQPLFGWSETELGGGPVALLLGMSAGNLAVGSAMHRLGVRATFAAGCMLAATGWIAAGSVTTLWQFMTAMGLVGLGAGTATIVPAIALISHAFHERRGLAIALFIGSCALASSAMPVVTGRLIETVAWRGAFRTVGAIAIMLVPLLMRFLPPRLPGDTAAEAAGTPQLPGLSRRQALRLPAFWVLTGVLTASQLCMNGVLFNTIAFLQKSGLTRNAAIELYSLTNFMSLPGLLIGGYMSDRISARWLLPSIVGVQALGTLALLGIGDGTPVQLAATIGFVVLWGGVAGLPAQSGSLLLGDIVGARSFAGLLGMMFTIIGFVGALAPGLTGWLHDQSGGYAMPLGLFASILLLAAAASLWCRPAQTRPNPA